MLTNTKQPQSVPIASLSGAWLASLGLTLILLLLAYGQVRAQNFTQQTGVSNPLNGADSRWYGTFVDIDNDGDLDVMAGHNTNAFRYYQNTGTTTSPAFAAVQNNPFGLTPIVGADYMAPSFKDLDNDGDLDLLTGSAGNNFYYYQNTGTVSSPAFAAPLTNPFGLTTSGNYTSANLGDLDNDGDLDLLSGLSDGTFRYYQNTGTVSSPAFASPVTNPFSLTTLPTSYSSPHFTDLDNDGDLDLFSGGSNGVYYYYQNTGTTSAPAFSAIQTNPFGLTTVASYPSPFVGDLNGDGSKDIMTSVYGDGVFRYYTGQPPLNNALNYDGTDDGVRTTSFPAVSGNFTVEAWVRPNTTSGAISIISTRGTGGSDLTFDFKLQNGNLIHGDIGNGGGWINIAADASFSYSVGVWYHIAYVVTNTGYTIYANGSQVGSGSYGFDTPLFTNGSSQIDIGHYQFSFERFNGSIDEVRVWNVARNGTQISNNMSLTMTGSESGLVAYYNFNHGVANANNAGITTLNDLASAGGTNNATLYNFALNGATSNWVGGAPVSTSSSITLSTGTLSGFNATTTASTSQTFTISGSNLTANASISVNTTDWELSTDNSTFSATLNLAQSGGNLTGQPVTVYIRLKSGLTGGTKTATLTASSTGATNQTISLNGNVTLPPALSLSASSLSGFNATTTTASTSQTFTISGSNLTANASISVNTTDWELSTDNSTFSATLNLAQSGGNLTGQPITVYVRLKSGLAIGAKTATLTASSTGATNQTISLSGNVTPPNTDVYWIDGTTVKKFDGVTTTTAINSIAAGEGIGVDEINGHIYVLNYSNNIVRHNIATMAGTTIFTGGSNLRDIAIDYYNGKIYWTDLFALNIRRANLDGSNVQTIVNSVNAFGIDLDLVNNKVYFAELGSSVRRCNLDGTSLETLVSGANATDVRDVAVDPVNNKMFWSLGTSNVIKTSDLSGNSPTNFLTGVGNTYGLQVDKDQGVLYYTEPANNRIRRINIDGTGVATYVNTPTIYWFALPNGPTQPTLYLSGNSLSGFTATNATASSSQTFTISGSNLTANASISVNTTDWELSTDNSTFSATLNLAQSGGNLTGQPITVYVRLKSGLALGAKTATLTASSTGATNQTVSLSGVAINATPSSVRGNMMSFDGVNDEINCGNVASLSFERTNAFSIEAWVKTNYGGSQQTIVSKMAHTAPFRGYELCIIPDGRLQFLLINNWPVSNIECFNTNTVNDGNWHHVTVTYDGSSSSVGVKFYVDGVLQTLTTGGNNSPVTGTTINSTPVLIGARSILPLPFNGSIDEVRIWNVVRTQAQIRENMHLTSRGGESGLVAYYQFNETSGNAIDAINGNNGTLNGGASRTTSTVSVARGVSTRLTAPAGASSQVFGNATVNFTAMTAPAANDEFVTYQLYDTPMNNVSANSTASNYWLVRQFGTQTFSYNQMTYTLPASNVISPTDVTTPSNLKLYKRNHNSGGAWGTEVGTGTSANNTTKVIVYNISPAQTSFSEFIPASVTSPLPITLIGLKGERVEGLRGEMTEEVKLEWTTAQEINNKGFEVETSEDGLAYQKIAFVEGRGNSQSLNMYQLSFINANDVYVRLKQVDFDGKYSYSPVVFVEGMEGKVVIYPNPNNGTFTLSVGNEKLDSPARLLNAQGKEMWRGVRTDKAHLVSTGLPTGIYFLHTTVAGKTKITKVVVRH